MKNILSAILISGLFAASGSPGADTPSSNSVEERFLHAARSGDLEKLKILLKSNPALVDSKDVGGATALHIAARERHKNVAALLLANKARVDARANDSGTPLLGTA